MILDSEELIGKHRNTILAHMLLSSGSTIHKDKFDKVVKIVHDSEDKLIDVKVLFNGIEFDGQILEDLIQEQWKHCCDTLEKKYSDLEKLADEKAKKAFNAYVNDVKNPTLEKLRQIQEKLSNIELDLECL